MLNIKPKSQLILGVDFSGATNAGSKIWISRTRLNNNCLVLEKCYPIKEIVENSNSSRDICLLVLQTFIKGATSCVVGIDTSFSIPRQLIKDKTWTAFINNFPDRYGSPEDFRKQCLISTNGKEYKRDYGEKVKAPFSAYNLRMYRQTYYGINSILSPLLKTNAVRVLPMQLYDPTVTSVLEVCPAVTLKKLGSYFPYKGKTKTCFNARLEILNLFRTKYRLEISDEGLINKIAEDSEGDALDSLIAAYASAKTLKSLQDNTLHTGLDQMLEGYIFS